MRGGEVLETGTRRRFERIHSKSIQLKEELQ